MRQLLKEASLFKYFRFLCSGNEDEWLHLQKDHHRIFPYGGRRWPCREYCLSSDCYPTLKKKLRLYGTWNYTVILQGFAFGPKPEQSLNVYKFSLQPFILKHYRARYFVSTWHLKISQSFNEQDYGVFHFLQNNFQVESILLDRPVHCSSLPGGKISYPNRRECLI